MVSSSCAFNFLLTKRSKIPPHQGQASNTVCRLQSGHIGLIMTLKQTTREIQNLLPQTALIFQTLSRNDSFSQRQLIEAPPHVSLSLQSIFKKVTKNPRQHLKFIIEKKLYRPTIWQRLIAGNIGWIVCNVKLMSFTILFWSILICQRPTSFGPNRDKIFP